MEQLPELTYLTPAKDLNMSIVISGKKSSDDDVIISLSHSSRGVNQDLTEYLVYEISEEADVDEEEVDQWRINMTLSYPYAQASGDLTLSVGDSHSGDVTTTRLIIVQEGTEVVPFFDPVPKSVKTYPGQDVLIDTLARGSIPISVSSFFIVEVVKFCEKCY